MASAAAIVGVGFCGGYTTFSTASFETVRLLEERRFGPAFWNTFGVLAATMFVAALGIVVGQRL